MSEDLLFDQANRVRRRPLAVCLGIGLALAGDASASDALPLPDASQLPRVAAFINGHAGALRTARANAQALASQAPLPSQPSGLLVTNCNDDGIGSLRYAAMNASPDDVIDLTHLPCSTITLTSGAIQFDDATVNGPGAASLTIDGNNEFQVIHHTGTGGLILNELTIANGKYSRSSGNAMGGCIYSAGAVQLNAALVTNCHAHASGDYSAYGGAIFSTGFTVLISSTVTGSSAETSGDADAYGGGIFSRYSLLSYYSTISDNVADGGANANGLGGGAMVIYSSIVRESTISGNRSEDTAGLFTCFAGTITSIYNSTISGNQSVNSTVGSGVFSGCLTNIANSTITENTEANDANQVGGAGLALGANALAQLVSSVIAENAIVTPFGTFPSDINGLPGSSLTGSHNIINLSILTTPIDTIVADPKLGPLADNGGLTATHALLSTSPAIDAGMNIGLQFDQRGSGFPRTFGADTDIGAFEYEGGPDDLIFRNGFETPL